MTDPRVTHYFDPEQRVGEAYREFFDLPFPAWDVWMLYAPGVRWDEPEPPPPTWWEHQLSALSGRQPERRLDAARFAARARAMAEPSR